MNKPTIILRNKAEIAGLSKSTKNKIKKCLTIDNPIFHQGLSLGLSNWGVPPNLCYYEELDNGIIKAPIGSLSKLLEIISQEVEISKSDIMDARKNSLLGKYFSKIKFNATLRDYQNDMIKSTENKTVGVIEAMTGAGKTIFALALILEKQAPTLFLVNTLELAEQTINSFCKFSNLDKSDIGFIGNGKFEIKPITIGLHQTMSRLTSKHFKLVNDMISMVIADEVHIVGASTYYETMTQLNAKYKWGISATPKRDDGLTDVIFFATGPKIHVVPKEKFKDVLIKPSYEVIKTDYDFPMICSQDYQEMISDLCLNEERMDLISKTAENYKTQMLVFLCLRVEQVERLTKKLGADATMLTSKMSKKDRKEVMEQLLSGSKRMIVSTYALFSTGIDIPKLEVLFMCAPMRSEVKLRQSAGRLMRKAEGKLSAKIIDFVDYRIGILSHQARSRAKILTNL